MCRIYTPTFYAGPGLTAQDVTTHAYLEKIAIDTAKQLGEGSMKLPARGPKNFTEKVNYKYVMFSYPIKQLDDNKIDN